MLVCPKCKDRLFQKSIIYGDDDTTITQHVYMCDTKEQDGITTEVGRTCLERQLKALGDDNSELKVLLWFMREDLANGGHRATATQKVQP